eukprot:7748890-Alexandrium_andersonii.AAC.1
MPKSVHEHVGEQALVSGRLQRKAAPLGHQSVDSVHAKPDIALSLRGPQHVPFAVRRVFAARSS